MGGERIWVSEGHKQIPQQNLQELLSHWSRDGSFATWSDGTASSMYNDPGTRVGVPMPAESIRYGDVVSEIGENDGKRSGDEKLRGTLQSLQGLGITSILYLIVSAKHSG